MTFINERIAMLVGYDTEYQEVLSECKKLEPEYQRIMASLPEQDRVLLDRYITLCEELEYRGAFLESQAQRE